MNKIRWINIVCSSILISCLLTSCSGALSVQKKQSRLVSQEAFAINDSLKLGRIDLADKHSDLLVKLVPPPAKKDRILIKPFRISPPPLREKQEENNKLQKLHGKAGPVKVDIEGKYFGLPGSELGENIVVLPEALKNKPVIVENSEEYKRLLAENEELKKQVKEQEQKLLAKQNEKVNQVIIEKEKVIEKAAEKELIARNSFWDNVKFWAIIAACVGGLGALMFFVPPAIPIVAGIFRGIIRVIGVIFNGIINLFKKKN